MLVLYDRRTVRREHALGRVRQHVVQMHCGDELDDGVTQELESLVVVNHARLLLLPRHLRHDLDQHVDACACAHIDR